jgi:hypothetical protein
MAAVAARIASLSVLSLAAIASAQPAAGSLLLDWEAPSGCPGRDAVLERTRALTERTATPGEPIRARGVVTAHRDDARTKTLWRLALETTQRSNTWQRSVEAESCQELMEAGALILALAIDPNLVSAAATEPPKPDATPEVPGSTSALPAKPRTSAERSRSTPSPAFVRPSEQSSAGPRSALALDLSIDASALGDVGSLPRPALGLEGAIGVAAGRLRLDATATLLPEARAVVARDPERGGDIGLWAFGARGAYEVLWKPLRAEGRLGFELGRIRGQGFGGTAWNMTRTSGWAAGRAGVGAALDLGRFRVRAAIEAVVPVIRPDFVFEGLDRVHRPAVVAGRVVLGVGAHF